MFNYHQPNVENLQQYLKEEESRSGAGPNWWSIPSGMSSVRILPPWDPTGRVALPVFMHPIEFKGKDRSFTKYNWTCVNKTFNKPCPICEGLANIAAAGVDTSNWEANRRQYYFNAIVMHDPTYNPQRNTGTAPGTQVLMKAPKTFYDWIISQITNPMIGDITNPQNGIDVYITKEGSGLGTTYSMTLSPNGRTPIPQEYLDKITDLYNLDDIFSAGFEQSQIDELMETLKRSAGILSTGIPQMSSQMAGYTQAPQMMNPQMMNPQQPQYNVPPTITSIPPMGAPTSAALGQTPPWTPASSQTPTGIPPMQMNTPAPTPTAPVSNTGSQSNLPKCFGNYDAGSVNCVVCNHEVDCSQKSTR